jgi:hypothetical protein
VILRGAGVAVISVFLAAACQWTLVHAGFHGDWSALFCAGDQFTHPNKMYLFPGPGYDGQFYQVIAHDPLLIRGYDRFVDVPRLRYRRILVPGLAYVLAAGKARRIDWAYFVVCWSLAGLGAFCLAHLAMQEKRTLWWGLLFLVTPATLATIERMTVDISLTALTVACLLAARLQRWRLLWLALAASALSKETGVLVVIAVCIWLARQHRVWLGAVLSSSLLPAAAWYAYVQSRTGGEFPTSEFNFISAFFACLKIPLEAGMVPLVLRAATVLSVIALLWMAIRSLALVFLNGFHDLPLIVCGLFGAFVLTFQSAPVWVDANGFTRVYSPLMVSLVAGTWRHGFGQTLTAFALVTLPMGIQLSVHIAGPLLRPLISH